MIMIRAAKDLKPIPEKVLPIRLQTFSVHENLKKKCKHWGHPRKEYNRSLALICLKCSKK